MLENEVNDYKNGLNEYLEKKQEALELLAETLGLDSNVLFYEYMRGNIPETGIIKNNKSFHFHGLGCSVVDRTIDSIVDLEFGPKGQALAFDKGTICYILDITLECDELINILQRNNIITLADRELYEIWLSNQEQIFENEYDEIDISVADRYILL